MELLVSLHLGKVPVLEEHLLGKVTELVQLLQDKVRCLVVHLREDKVTDQKELGKVHGLKEHMKVVQEDKGLPMMEDMGCWN